jgi:outer membrane receptor protein involved in Fe transport
MSVLHRVMTILAFVVAPSAAAARVADAQEQLAYNDRAPRFLAFVDGAMKPLDVQRTAVLNQRLALDLDGVTVKAALEEIIARSALRLVYRDELLPAGPRVHLRASEITVASALAAVLLDAQVDVGFERGGGAVLVRRSSDGRPPAGTIVGRTTDAKAGTALVGATVVIEGTSRSAVSGTDGRYRITDVPPGTYTVRARYIGFAPGIASVTVTADQDVTADFALAKSVQRLDEVVTTGTVVESQVKTLPSPITVIKADDIERLGIRRVDDLFRGQIPGALKLDSGAGDGYPAIAFRGASDFSQSLGNEPYKVYVDGVEVAYGNVISQMDAGLIDRVEIVRGPQASTIYGSGAIVGVIQIFTKKGEAGVGKPRVKASAAAGGLSSQWADNWTLQQDYSADVTGSLPSVSYHLGGSYQSLGEWVPEYRSKDRSMYAGARTVSGPLAVEISGNYSDRLYNSSPITPYVLQQIRSGRWDTGFNAFYTTPFNPDIDRKSGTLGTTVELHTTPWWEQRLTIGYNAYDNPRSVTAPRFFVPSDSLFGFSEFLTTRASLSYNTTLTARPTDLLRTSLTLGIDGFNAKERISSGNQDSIGTFVGSTFIRRSDYTNRGYYAQAQIGVAERVYLTGGIRADDNSNFGADYGLSVAPRVGLAVTQPIGTGSIKLRGSWGKAIEAPLPYQRSASQGVFDIQLANDQLGPETQQGFDAGVELDYGRVSLQGTYYAQHIDGVISSVTIGDPNAPVPSFQFLNLGRISNKGLELEGTLRAAPFAVSANFTVFDSHAEELTPSATGTDQGQYLPGDRLLAIPRNSGGLSLSYGARRTAATVSLTYVGSFRNYDYIALDDARYGSGTFTNYRDYIIDYPAFVKGNLRVSQGLTDQWGVFARVDNLWDSQSSEISNTTPVLGRLVMLGASMDIR